MKKLTVLLALAAALATAACGDQASSLGPTPVTVTAPPAPQPLSTVAILD